MKVEDQIRESWRELAAGPGLPKVAHVDFAALKLRPGTWLQLRSLFDHAPSCDVEFAALRQGRSIYVTLPSAAAGKRCMQTGDRYLVSGFNGTSEFTFTSQVLQVQDWPFYLAHLAYPDSVEVRVVREAQRVNTSIRAVAMHHSTNKYSPATIKNLSAAGAMTESMTLLGEMGEKVDIVFQVQFERRQTDLSLSAQIRHVNRHDADGLIRTGLEFCDVPKNDKLLLYYLLFTLSQNE